MNRFCAALPTFLAATLGAVAPPAGAAVGHVAQHGLTWTLLDLDPADGIAPALRFLPLPPPPGDPASDARGHVLTVAAGVLDEAVVPGSGSDPIVAAVDSAPFAAVTGRIDGRADPATHVLTLDLLANAGASSTQAFGSMQSGPLPFILGANTAVTFHTTVHLQGQLDPEPGRIELYTGSATLTITPEGTSPGTGVLADAAFLFLEGGGATAGDETRQLTVDYANRTAGELGGNIALGVGTVGVATLVPEPGMLPMALAGLGVLGWRMRRRS